MVCGGMLLRVYQTAIFIAVAWANIYFQLVSNPYIVAVTAFLVAYSLTSLPLTVYDWWVYRDARRAEYAHRKAAGMTYGWRRHLPWNAGKRG